MPIRPDAKIRGAGAEGATTIVVHDQIEPTRADWLSLLEVSTASPYQSFDLQSTWMETIGRRRALEPYIVVAHDCDGRPLALLPLAVERRAGLRIASFIGGREANLNLGLFRPGAFDRDAARRLLLTAARQTPNPPDLYYLRNQPRRFDGADNPLAFADAFGSASFAYQTQLPPTPEELTARVSKDTRKKLRKKEARLAEMGALRYDHCASGECGRAILSALIEQKQKRFAEMNVAPLFELGLRDFLESCAVSDSALELHGLSVGERVVATYAGFSRGGRFSAMLNSFDMDETIARSSPGDLLLHAMMRNLVERGMRVFDLGVGEARYKQSVCDETVELCDAIAPVTAKGSVAAPLFARYLQIKRRAKQSPQFARFASRLRHFAPFA